MPEIRAFQPADLPALYDICVRTAAAGGDARGHYSTDALMGDLFAAPYVHLAPELAFVLEDEGEAVGYVVGTADTTAFARRYRDEWIPLLADRYPVPPPPPRTADQDMHALHHYPERMIVAGLEGFPAHLHIDLLPQYQRQGHGRRLIERFLSVVPAPGVHVGMLTENVEARAFYDRLGFTELPVPDPGPLTYLGINSRR
ncbi:ribosomal protein S18 acetylase RimI-like enzyme [Actinoplanes lutulentus]|uniref:Acetyltransferase (GNAT) family protein n=1 Tax=Actinoplanes lutulentus TaxID=1287878 RepID=A0A327YZZ2_9ACTN|nr:GNAT family N-acetyltransferase [Actinoplanes lutulentus]MBB2943564.1 ribosomal protein S18 acetylase RimI-like enzyme [Actinoplanes lutulentus]RAK27430.1 acetyltransferase (GNAT) family protein [Actinoplanes lutulentus]